MTNDKNILEQNVGISTSSPKSVLTSDHIEIYPYKFTQILEFSMKQKVNQHGELSIKGYIDAGLRDRYIEDARFGQTVRVSRMDESDNIIMFDGILQKISIYQDGQLYLMEFQAVTGTYFMDIHKVRRSFQDNSMPYHELTSKIASMYAGGNTISTVGDQCLNGFILQYDETDWEFLVRMASHFNQGIYPCIDIAEPKCYFGNPQFQSTNTIDAISYSVYNDIGTASVNKENFIDDVTISDFTMYIVETYDNIPLGAKVMFHGQLFYIKEIGTSLVRGEIRNKYVLCKEKGLKQPYQKNEALQGISVNGKVIDVERDKVKVHLDEIDQMQDASTAHWFTYSTVYASHDGSGWYCMPEKGDRVRVQFANTDDFSAYAVSSVSESDSDRMNDYNIRYIKNPQGMEITMTPNQVILSANNESLIVMDQDGNIQIHGEAGISLSSSNNISISAGNKISMQASENINLLCGGKSEIDLSSSGVTQLKGTTVYTN